MTKPINATQGSENVCEPAVKYKFSKKFGCWVRTWFTVETDKGNYFKQHIAFSKNRDTPWERWNTKPV